MINLTNHECSHCRGQSRRVRTGHGNWSEYTRQKQVELDEAIQKHQIKRIPWLRYEVERGLAMMRLFEYKG